MNSLITNVIFHYQASHNARARTPYGLRTSVGHSCWRSVPSPARASWFPPISLLRSAACALASRRRSPCCPDRLIRVGKVPLAGEDRLGRGITGPSRAHAPRLPVVDVHLSGWLRENTADAASSRLVPHVPCVIPGHSAWRIYPLCRAPVSSWRPPTRSRTAHPGSKADFTRGRAAPLEKLIFMGHLIIG